MILLQVKNQLIQFYLSYDTFEFERHQLEITFDKESADFRAQMLGFALEEFEVAGLVKKVTLNERTAWVLTKPINSFIQQVNVGPHVANMLASTIDGINELEEIEGVCDVMKIDEDDLMRVIMFANEMLDVVESDGPPKGGAK